MTERLDHFAGHIVVVGSGLAGMVTALALAPQPVVLVTRAALSAESSSGWAQGGIAASLGGDDRPQFHIADTIEAGSGLCDGDVVSSILPDAAKAIATLESFGVRFDRAPDGNLVFGLEAAHSRRRIVHVGGDGSGAGIVRALAERVRDTPSIQVLENVEVRRLLMADGTLCGLLCAIGKAALILPASRVVLATGSLGGLYETTTTPTGNYGQGIMLAARAGAELADMEFVQFHPTALDTGGGTSGSPLGLVSEAVRGEGAIVVNDLGERFLADQPGAELGPRDIVARAITAEISKGGRVFLDARAKPGQDFTRRFPAIAAACRQAGIDPARDRIPVRPAVHYHMGGVATDLAGRSTVEGLWAVGEAASTGLHGANRLASNSLLEAVVMAMRVAGDIAATTPASVAALPPVRLPVAADLFAVRHIVSRHLGVVRNGRGIAQAVVDLLPLAEGDGPAADPALVALAIAVFASLRQESRGAHARIDFPLTLPQAQRRRMTLDAILAAARDASSPTKIHTAQRMSS